MNYISKNLKGIPSILEENIGQHNEKIRFLLKQNKCTTFFTESEIIISLIKLKEIEDIKTIGLKNYKSIDKESYDTNLLRITLEGINESSRIIAENKINYNVNYFKGRIKSQWKTNIPIYEKVIYRDIYKGIDLTYYGLEGRLEQYFIVYPDGDINTLSINLKGSIALALDGDGNVNIVLKDNSIGILKPNAYQKIDGINKEVASSYILEGETIKIKVEEYEKDKPLIISSPFLYDSYISENIYNIGNSICVDENQYAYMTGFIASGSFPLEDGDGNNESYADIDAFLIKMDTNFKEDNKVLSVSYIGGSVSEAGLSLDVDDKECVYIAGVTNSRNDFPITDNAYAGTYNGGEYDGFLIKLDTKVNGQEEILYSTYLGGDGSDYVNSIKVDYDNYVYIVGGTNSINNFPITKNSYQPANLYKNQAGFLLKIDTVSSGKASLVYGTFLGGNSDELDFGTEAFAVDIDEIGYAYITGRTNSNIGFPITNTAFQPIYPGGYSSAFLIKIDTESYGGLGLIYGTYIGGNGLDEGLALAVDINQCIYITGATSSQRGFPITKSSYQQEFKGGFYSAYLLKIDTKVSGINGLVYGSYFGGNGDDYGTAIVIDENRYVYLTGYTNSIVDFPISKAAYEATLESGCNASYLVKLDTRLKGEKALLYSTYLSLNEANIALDIAVDKNYNAYISGIMAETAEDISQAGECYCAYVIKVNTLVCDLVLNEEVSSNIINIGDNIVYTIRIINNGPEIATNIIVSDVLPRELGIDSYRALKGRILDIDDNRVIWTIPSLAVGEKVVAVIVCTVLRKGDYLINSALVECDNNLLNKYNGVDTVITYIDYTSQVAVKREEEIEKEQAVIKEALKNNEYIIDSNYNSIDANHGVVQKNVDLIENSYNNKENNYNRIDYNYNRIDSNYKKPENGFTRVEKNRNKSNNYKKNKGDDNDKKPKDDVEKHYVRLTRNNDSNK